MSATRANARQENAQRVQHCETQSNVRLTQSEEHTPLTQHSTGNTHAHRKSANDTRRAEMPRLARHSHRMSSSSITTQSLPSHSLQCVCGDSFRHVSQRFISHRATGTEGFNHDSFNHHHKSLHANHDFAEAVQTSSHQASHVTNNSCTHRLKFRTLTLAYARVGVCNFAEISFHNVLRHRRIHHVNQRNTKRI